ncbi:hypothetical protein GCM10010515_26940 [Streptomyces fructofermentans]|uniref:Uncharacterized protein n=1 Tax=Streptomyces fructofermentans TaxID=152141 RepID=A0A918KCV0_9ACTN|nr:hypothetical protein GCM10010515_26940 [Streptomyces fructofermentans]
MAVTSVTPPVTIHSRCSRAAQEWSRAAFGPSSRSTRPHPLSPSAPAPGILPSLAPGTAHLITSGCTVRQQSSD